MLMVGTGWETGGRSGPAAGQDPTVPGSRGHALSSQSRLSQKGIMGKIYASRRAQGPAVRPRQVLSLPAPGNEVSLSPSAGQMEH